MEVSEGVESEKWQVTVCNPLKALYGMKQNSWRWIYFSYLCFASMAVMDVLAYILRRNEWYSSIISALLVDESLTSWNNMATIQWINLELTEMCKAKDLGEAQSFHKLEIQPRR